MNEFKCHYCGERVDVSETLCSQCNAFLGKPLKSRLFLWILLTIGACFSLFTIWTGYNLFFSA
ncbi:MAG: hypothetical protein HOG03_10015 [Desulfobacula sp.]|uniref:hypothetical protein n=1 Tax=Desulfobacula sp. TaxID=2593537 RepID=UPI001D384CF5|nr:hypothetical protein [Desulfobacula sp.]MBT3483640.1 hypothetical protein [Desulfobacula sp.]MBT3804921.1 hypothetical protein [Desulfobacula sp.]MBT4023377.1 hypothetical protein [Desulfobacula sp.]MBT4197363.1 hypothetical protein [Desulfobacula sp.]